MVNDLLKAAQKAPRAERAVRTTDMWMPAVMELRGKNYTYAAIHEFLKAHGEDVHPNVTTFTSAVSRRLRAWITNQISK
jgi:hypothetical protein